MSPVPDIRFDVERADLATNWYQRVLVHTKGRFARSPFILADWQRDDIIRPLFGTVRYDDQIERWVRAYTLAWIELARKQGKALQVGTPIPTASGWKAIEALVPGDEVFAPDGSLTRVLWSSGVQRRPGFALRFADGAELIACDEHRWLVNDRVQGWHGKDPRRVATTTELAGTLTHGARGDHRYTLTVPAAIRPPESGLPLDPYVLGVWLGDGTTARGEITTADVEILDALAEAGYQVSYRYERGRAATVGLPGLVTALRATGVLGNKHIPEPYLFASEGQRRRLLAGLLDTDGSAMAHPKRASSSRVEFVSTNERLATDTATLIRSLGWKASIGKGIARLNGVELGPKFRVTFTAFADESPFGLTRKNSRLPNRPSKAPRSKTNAIVAVDSIGEIDGVCIAVDHPSRCFLAGRSFTPTHNSELVAGAGLYLLIADGEEEAEIFGAAKDRDQAGVVYQVAKRMVELSPFLSRLVEKKQLAVIDSKKRIVHEPTGSFYQVVASDAGGNLGTNPHGILFDEVITQPSRELWDDLKTGMGTRSQPLMLAITTAGNDPSSMAFEEHVYSEKVARDPASDPSRFVYMRNTPDDVDPWDEANWTHAMPALGDFFRIQTVRDEAREAQTSPRKMNAFFQFRLNRWVRQVIRWLDLGLWDENAGLVSESALEGEECFGGLDLASTSDFAACVLFFPGEVEDHLVCRFWLPEGALERRSPMREVIQSWADNGYLRLTPGDVIDQRAIYDDIDKLAQRFNIVQLGYDRWNASQLIHDLEDAGLYCNGIPQTTTELNAPSKELERLMGLKRLRHGGHPVLRWMVDNVTVLTDSNGNIKPDRKKSTEKIDGVVAMVMALHESLDDAASTPYAVTLNGG